MQIISLGIKKDVTDACLGIRSNYLENNISVTFKHLIPSFEKRAEFSILYTSNKFLLFLKDSIR